MNEKALRDIFMYLELGAYAARKAIKRVNEGKGAPDESAEYWTGVAETLEETADMIAKITGVTKNERIR